MNHTDQPRTVTQLAEIPRLAWQATLCRDHPWRGDHIATRRGRPDQYPAPTSLDWLDLMDTRTGALTQLADLAQHIHQQLPHTTTTVPAPATWQAVCAWLTHTRRDWSALDDADHTTATISRIHASLDSLIGRLPTLTVRCPQDGWELKPETGVYTCPVGHRYDISDELQRLAITATATATTTEICDMLDIARKQLSNWAARGYLKPAGRRGQQRLWSVNDAAACATQHRDTPRGRPQLAYLTLAA
jgi:hypothetical protein